MDLVHSSYVILELLYFFIIYTSNFRYKAEIFVFFSIRCFESTIYDWYSKHSTAHGMMRHYRR